MAQAPIYITFSVDDLEYKSSLFTKCFASFLYTCQDSLSIFPVVFFRGHTLCLSLLSGNEEIFHQTTAAIYTTLLSIPPFPESSNFLPFVLPPKQENLCICLISFERGQKKGKIENSVPASRTLLSSFAQNIP